MEWQSRVTWPPPPGRAGGQAGIVAARSPGSCTEARETTIRERRLPTIKRSHPPIANAGSGAEMAAARLFVSFKRCSRHARSRCMPEAVHEPLERGDVAQDAIIGYTGKKRTGVR